jgi:hypothetical protein
LVALTGCDAVTLNAPIGEPLSKSEKAEFVGRWIDGESEVCDIQLTKDEFIVFGWMAWDEDEDRHIAKDQRVHCRQVGNAIYFLILDDPIDVKFARIERASEAEFSVHLPDAAKFRTAIEQGKLKGTIVSENDNFTAKIDVSSSSTDTVFSSEDYLDWYLKEPIKTFRRIEQHNAAATKESDGKKPIE